jgi:hypothetical protein
MAQVLLNDIAPGDGSLAGKAGEIRCRHRAVGLNIKWKKMSAPGDGKLLYPF